VPINRGFGAIAVVIAMAICAVPAPASADSVTAPQVFVRLVDANNGTVGATPWQPLSATLSSMGPYEIGVALQATSAEYNRQAAQIDLISAPGGPVPGDWSNFDPYAPYCQTLAGAPGTIEATAAHLYFHGDGTYTMNVAMYTDAQHNAFPGNTCSGGPTSTVTLTVNAAPSVRIAGTPLVPRTTRRARGDNGPVVSTPQAAQGFNWRCARDPVTAPDGSLTGTATTGDTAGDIGSGTFPLRETDAFSGPGRWACAVQALGGDNIGNLFPSPWVDTPPVIVKGEFVRDQTRTSLRRLAHGRMRLTIPAIKTVAAAAAHGKLTVTIDRAQCLSVRRGTVRLHRVLSRRITLDGAGRGSLVFSSPRRPGFYLGRITFGGTALILPGADANMLLGVFPPANFHLKPSIQFVDPTQWAPCA
jgi:hypothetical protein